MKRLVIFGNTYQQGNVNTVLGLLEHLRQHGINVAVEKEYMQYLSREQDINLPTFDATQVPDADMALSLGGDGTFLTTGDAHLGHKFGPLGLPYGRQS